jgi:hypothetical protein
MVHYGIYGAIKHYVAIWKYMEEYGAIWSIIEQYGANGKIWSTFLEQYGVYYNGWKLYQLRLWIAWVGLIVAFSVKACATFRIRAG